MNGWILFFVCGLIDYIARKTKNKRADIVNWLGKDRLQKIYDLADVYPVSYTHLRAHET